MPTSEELLELAEPCAKKIDISQGMRHFPSFSEAEEQCEDEYDKLLEAIHEDQLISHARNSWLKKLHEDYQKTFVL